PPTQITTLLPYPTLFRSVPKKPADLTAPWAARHENGAAPRQSHRHSCLSRRHLQQDISLTQCFGILIAAPATASLRALSCTDGGDRKSTRLNSSHRTTSY